MEFDIDKAIQARLASKTDQEREEEARFQTEQRAKFNVPTDSEIRSELGRRMMASALETLAEGVSIEALDKLAASYALQGDYESALRFIQDPTVRAVYMKIHKGLQTAEDCSCPKKVNGVDTRFIKDRIPQNGTIRNLIACAICGHLRC